MNEQELREALGRVASSGPPAPSGREMLSAARRRRRRRWAAPAAASVAAAAAAAAVLVVPAVLPDRPGPGPAGGRVSASDMAAPLAVPGRTAAELRSMALECATTYAGGPDDPRGVLRRAAGQFRIYNTVQDEAGSVSLIYMPGTEIACGVPAGTTNTQVNEQQLLHTSLKWLPGVVSLDFRDSSRAAGDGQPDHELFAGRVSGAAATVTVSGANGTRTVPVVNGTYLIRFTAPAGRLTVHEPVTIRAHDRTGTLLGDVPEGRIWTCYRLPSGQQISEPGPDTGKTCPTAEPWAAS